MQLSVTRHHSRRGDGLTGVLAALGLGTGIATGFVLGSLFGAGGHRRMGRMVSGARKARATPERRVVLMERVRAALAADPVLGGSHFELLAIGRQGLALHGWVATRSARARADRVARAAAAGEPIINRILVHGEDDAPVPLVREDAPRSA
jgi:hypothetical protein